MRSLRFLALCAVLPLAGCLKYVVAPPADPVKALKAPVYVEDMAKVTRNDSGAIRFILRVRAPHDTAIILLLGEQAEGLRGQPGRPAIRLSTDSARRSLQRGPLVLADSTTSGSSAVTVPPNSKRLVSILVMPSDTLPPEFAVDLTWYMRPAGDTTLIERREDKSRVARMNQVPVAPVIASALLAIIGFFLVTTH